ncbi:hypothetical protein F2Q69_00058818 [Brassica cretica]|uniref:Uncharacterized protein n=1 Tax=Brassica cretica TaxID=69181 RepID=A0A8S9RMM2_BRACR|nr:hypothetical protein F2Q69_00058818 [Brassica cretica]
MGPFILLHPWGCIQSLSSSSSKLASGSIMLASAPQIQKRDWSLDSYKTGMMENMELQLLTNGNVKTKCTPAVQKNLVLKVASKRGKLSRMDSISLGSNDNVPFLRNSGNSTETGSSRPFLAFLVLFFAAVWLMPLISKPPEMTLITIFCRGGEAATALGPVLIPALTSASCLLFGLLVGFFISVAYVVSSPLLILLLLDFGSTCNVFFPFYLHSGPGEYIFHGFALVVGEFFLYVTIRKYASFEGGDCGGGVTSGH